MYRGSLTDKKKDLSFSRFKKIYTKETKQKVTLLKKERSTTYLVLPDTHKATTCLTELRGRGVGSQFETGWVAHYKQFFSIYRT
jgi:hypothetical protein